jgi:hypothetical protein
VGEIKLSDVIRSRRYGCFKVCESAAWGRFLIPTEDPKGMKLSKFERRGIQLIPDFPVIPANLWSRFISLCFYMCPPGKKSNSKHDSELEVQICLLRDSETKTKWKIVVPKQKVSGVSVKAKLDECIDIETGEKYDIFPPVGWLHAGSAHSHNTMEAYFSSTDDESELGIPGLHIVVGNIDHKKMTYTYEASIVLRGYRKEVENLEDVVDTKPKKLEFHKDVLEYIDAVIYKRIKFGPGSVDFGPGSIFWSSEDDEKEFDIPLLFDKDGKPDGFLYGLDKTNSDLYDDVEDYRDIRDELIRNPDVQRLVEEGISMEEIIQSMERAKRDIEEEMSSEI